MNCQLDHKVTGCTGKSRLKQWVQSNHTHGKNLCLLYVRHNDVMLL